MELSTISPADMRAVLIGAGRDARLRKKAVSIPVNRRTDTDRSALFKWSHGAKEARLEKNSKLLDFVSDSSARYVESVFLMFSRTLLANNKLLNFYVLDACAGKVF